MLSANKLQTIEAAHKSLKALVREERVKDSNEIQYYENSHTSEVKHAFTHAKRLLAKSFQQQDYQLFLNAIEVFQSLAYIPNVRIYFVDTVILSAKIPLLSQLADEMFVSPEMFQKTIKLSQYHFENYLIKADIQFDSETQQYVQANDESHLPSLTLACSNSSI